MEQKSIPGKPGRDQLMVTIYDQTAVVRVVGRGSFKMSTSLKQFGVAAVESLCRHLVLDMDECIGMDSTFMGVLAGLAVRLKQKTGGDIVLINLAPRTNGLLCTLGLDRIIRAHLAGAEPPEFADLLNRAAPTELPVGHQSRDTTARTILEAHESLVELTPENYPKFKDVLTYLREDLAQDEGLNDAPSAG
jgi:anti-sigma B factor antagonist